ncbi:unnamed protein product [Eruca vesicaria subsp. sativa]|uniref:Uncharacterized protein n=1 Tax=Eruca vesicaria subsp. sativa TaxID=29727 RepID=A0ABC8LGJ3_ERUVS|nr:unnamed protein product [Eruca vesicaria subsp. sativa]
MENLNENYTEKSLGKEVSPCLDPVVQATVGEAKERLKKLEQDYQRTFKKYGEVQLNRYRCHVDGKGLKHHSYWTGYCIRCCKNQVKELQNVLDRVNIEQVSQRGTETLNHSQKFLMLHGCRNLAQEKMILQQKAEHIQPNNEKLSKTKFDFREANFNREFQGILEEVPKICSKKHVHNLLSELKETNRLRKAATEGGAIVGNNNTSQDTIQTCTSSVIKLLTKIIRDFEKEEWRQRTFWKTKEKLKMYAEKRLDSYEKSMNA